MTSLLSCLVCAVRVTMERKTTLSVSSIALSDVSHDLFNFEMNFRSDEVITDDEAILYDIFVASLHPATTEKLKVFHCHTIIIKKALGSEKLRSQRQLISWRRITPSRLGKCANLISLIVNLG